MARILIVDDHPLFRRGLAATIGGEPDLEVCGEAADASEALRQVTALGPDLVIVDLSLKKGHGIELVKQIRVRDDRVKILVCSMHDDALFAERSLHAGACGYINKQEAIGTVIDCLRTVLDNRIYLSPEAAQRVLARGHQVGEASERWPCESFSDRELAVFEFIGQGLTTRAIADQLHLSVKTVETYREHIKAKLGLRNGAQLACHAAQWVLLKR